MLDELIAAYRKHIGEGQLPDEAARLVAESVAGNPELLASAWGELARAAFPLLGRTFRQATRIGTPGKPWFERTEWKSWQQIPVPVGNTGRRLVGAKIGKVEAATIGQFLSRHGMTAVKRGRAFEAAAKLMTNGQKLPDVLPKMEKAEQRAIGEYILSFRSALSA